jgi:purine nucleosidase
MISGFETPLGKFTLDCNERALQAAFEQTGERGMSLPDPVAMAVALDPTICTHSTKCYVDIETKSELTRGMTVVDQLDVTGDERNRAHWSEIRSRPPNVSVVWEIDVMRWKEALYTVLR